MKHARGRKKSAQFATYERHRCGTGVMKKTSFGQPPYTCSTRCGIWLVRSRVFMPRQSGMKVRGSGISYRPNSKAGLSGGSRSSQLPEWWKSHTNSLGKVFARVCQLELAHHERSSC